MEFLTPEILKTIIDAGISVVLALVVIYWYRTDSIEQLRESKDKVIEERNDKLLALNIIKDNTNAIANNTNAIEKVLEICNKIEEKISRN